MGEQLTFEGVGGGGGRERFGQFSNDKQGSQKAVHDMELIVHGFFLALRCCNNFFQNLPSTSPQKINGPPIRVHNNLSSGRPSVKTY